MAEYIAQTDRHVVYSPNRTKFVVPSEVLTQINHRIRSASEDALSSARSPHAGDGHDDSMSSPGRMSTSRPSSARSSRGRLSYTSTITPPRGIEDVLLVDSAISPQAFHMPTEEELTIGKSITMSNHRSRSKSPNGMRASSMSSSKRADGMLTSTTDSPPLHLVKIVAVQRKALSCNCYLLIDGAWGCKAHPSKAHSIAE